MRTFLLSAAIFMLVFVAGAPSGARTQTNEAKIYGYFFFAGKVPAAFKDIDVMDISLPGYVDSAKHGAPDYGRIRLKGRRAVDYLLLKPTLDGNNLSFTTKTVGGVHYEFSGTLTKTNFEKTEPGPDEIVLKGTLKKLRAGKAIATSKVSYTWSVGD